LRISSRARTSQDDRELTEDDLLTTARRMAVRELRNLRADGAPVAAFSDIAHRALARASRERQRNISAERLRRWGAEIVDHLRALD